MFSCFDIIYFSTQRQWCNLYPKMDLQRCLQEDLTCPTGQHCLDIQCMQIPTLPPPAEDAYLSNMAVDAKVKGYLFQLIRYRRHTIGHALLSKHSQ